MLHVLRSSIPLFFLLAFLFPSVVKEIHTVHHEEQVVCDAEVENHFHEHHEECCFCDVVMPVVPEPSKAQISIAAHHFAGYVFPCFVEVYFPSFHFSSSQLRAPPVLS